jgi:hypothetical protein
MPSRRTPDEHHTPRLVQCRGHRRALIGAAPTAAAQTNTVNEARIPRQTQLSFRLTF